MRISGPVVGYKFKYHRVKFYLFGDHHFSRSQSCDEPCTKLTKNKKYYDYNSDCFRIDAWLHKQCLKENVDVYLEESYFNTQGPGEKNDYLGLLQHQFYKELQKEKSYSSVRFHQLDIRVIEDRSAVLDIILYNNQQSKLIDVYYKIGKPLFEIYLTSDNFTHDVTKLIKRTNLSHKKQKWLLKRLLHQRMVCDNISRIRKQLLALPTKIQIRLIAFLLGEYQIGRGDIVPQLMRNGSLYMDAYALARMLRDFGAQNKIVYAGEGHIQLYQRFFSSLGISVKESTAISKRCQRFKP